ncbi:MULTISPECIES: Hsp70 family protein [unclassified Mycobacterium]|uniref:Hsp70 family protein n=1 Tax=unclassified Mycobacterium TaxID=2642494 RepID=UPI0029C80ED4|nr:MULTISPECIES: Hsp70 family protein [unclassified Mycobacterium]
MHTNRHAGLRNSLGISVGATNLAAVHGAQTIIAPAVVRTAQGGWLSGFVDRIGDPVPLVASDGSTHRPEALLAEALETTIMGATHGAPVSNVAMAVPAHWSPSTVAALRSDGSNHRLLVSDATAAAWALRTEVGLPSRGVVVVCDFGGSGTSITLLDAASDFARIGDTVRVTDFSGDLVDQAILYKVVAELSDASQTDSSGTAMVGSLARLRQACRLAKHRLSAETATAITVDLPGTQTSVRLTRGELETLVEGRLGMVVGELEDALLRNGIAPQHVAAVAAVGGGARIPLVTQTLSQQLRAPVITTPNPQLAAAAGAVLMATAESDPRTELTRTALAPTAAKSAPTAATPAPTALAWSQAEPDELDAFDPLEASRPDVDFDHGSDVPAPERRRGPVLLFVAAAAAAAAALAVVGMTSFAQDLTPASAVSTIAVSTAPVSSTQLPVSQAGETQPVVAETVVVTQAPRRVPVEQPKPQQPAPVVTTTPPPPVTTTTATPTTTTTTTPTTTTSTTPPTTTTPTSTTTTATSAPEVTIKHPIVVNPQPSV